MTIEQISKYVPTSKCGKYVYPIDSVTGAKTFAPIDYFNKRLEKDFGGSIERFVKEYTSRETKKYLKEGWSVEGLREIVAKNGKLPKLDRKPKKDPNAPKKVRRKRLAAHAETSTVVTNEDGTKEVIRVYPWSQDPTNFFRAAPVLESVEVLTKNACLRPDIYLDDECYGCNYYKECTCDLKNHKLK
jgi:hypothetical protein